MRNWIYEKLPDGMALMVLRVSPKTSNQRAGWIILVQSSVES
ncbi:hypothetical protein DYY67_0411 [Candidatus Nitrosotalea sp. TS]|nr:hypothetical protein [Candidatus Nitrosotalea sp. TS]